MVGVKAAVAVSGLAVMMILEGGVFSSALTLGEPPHRQDYAALFLCFLFGRRSSPSAQFIAVLSRPIFSASIGRQPILFSGASRREDRATFLSDSHKRASGHGTEDRRHPFG
jgi:hypothetical protein